MVLAVSYNQPKFCPSTTWNPNAITFASENTVGTLLPSIFVNSNDTVYVANQEKGEIVIWLNGSMNPTRIISGNWLNPLSIFVTTNGDIYVDNGDPNRRVDKWISNTNTSISVMFFSESCYGLFVDINDTLYCSLYYGHQVVKKRVDDNESGVTVAAGTGIYGSAANMLKNPVGIYVDIKFDLYVADCGNGRIQLFRSGQLNGTTIAGGDGSSTTTIPLNCPTGIVLDADGYLFIVDQNNHRIVGSRSNDFRCLVGCSGSLGSESNQLNYPRTLSFDSLGNIYVTDRDNNRIQKFLLATNSCSAYDYTLLSSTKRS